MTELILTGLQLVLGLTGQVMKIATDARDNKINIDEARERLRELVDKIDSVPSELRDELHKRLSDVGR